MRRLIAGMQSSVDGKIEGPHGYADWVDDWSDHYDLMPHIDACLLGAGMYPGYEQYWTAVHNEPDTPLVTGRGATPGERAWANFAVRTPHYVLSSTLTSAAWPNTSFVRGLDDIGGLKQQPGKDIYLIGGARTVASLLDAGLVDELRLTVYPMIAGPGKMLFATTERRRALELRDMQRLQGGRIGLIYGIDLAS
jgi:dihydrofolate reductase